jgi:Zn-dependent M28 family amino/carboxypeptidase
VSDTIAEIPGSDLKDQIVMVGGHLDSWHAAQGATDNAVGAACAMEAVRIIQSLGLHPRRTIRVGLWTGEGQGLLGSISYVKHHLADLPDQPDLFSGTPPKFLLRNLVKKEEYDRLSVYFNLDNGTGKIRGLYAQSNPAAVPLFKQWLAPFADLDASTVTLSNTGSTDHISFDRVGVPGFQFIQDPIEYMNRTHHSNEDTFDRIQIDDMKQASTIMAACLWDAASMDQRFPRKADK